MKNFKTPLTILFGILMIAAGIMHFASPAIYFGFIPQFLPKLVVSYSAGIVEIALGVGTFIPATRKMATLGILLLMLLFLPLHIVDVFRQFPAIGSHQTAIIRLPVQFVLILWAWFINKKV